jgi:flavin-dependent dehydrogenase
VTETTVIIVGGGPGGASCAGRLRRHGIDSIVLDSAVFPRTKLCAGWVTPQVFRSLEMKPSEYPLGLVPLTRICTEYFSGSTRSWSVSVKSTQYSVRRYEFDDWLLARSGARVFHHQARNIEHRGDSFVVDGSFRGRYLVGAGGTHCPVFRSFFKKLNVRSREYQVAALEEEFQLESPSSQECHLWFGENGLVGYSWYVPKRNGWVNVGLGGFSRYLADSAVALQDHWEAFVRKLEFLELVRGHVYRPKGHTYYLREPAEIVQLGNVYLVGDAAGLATCDLAEGIGPAIESGLRAADAIAGGREYSVRDIGRYSLIGPGVTASVMAHVLDRRGLRFRDWVFAHNWRDKEHAFKRRVEVVRGVRGVTP